MDFWNLMNQNDLTNTRIYVGYMKNDDDIAALAEMNLRQMDALL